MNPNSSSGLRILLWLLMMAAGMDKEGEAMIIGPVSFKPLPRNRLMTDNFLSGMRVAARGVSAGSSGSTSGQPLPIPPAADFMATSTPVRHVNTRASQERESFDPDIPFQQAQSYKPYAVYPTYRAGNFENPFNTKNGNVSPFKNLFGTDIGKSNSGLSFGFKNGQQGESIADLSSNGRTTGIGKFDNDKSINHPFSSIRLNPITQVSGISQQNPNFNTNSPYSKNNNQFSARNHPLFSFDNRAEKFEHMNPFEKPIHRNAFPLPSVNEPITLDLAEDEQKRVLFLKNNRKLPPSRNFVDTLRDEPSSQSNYRFLPVDKDKNLSLPPLPSLPSEKRNGDEVGKENGKEASKVTSPGSVWTNPIPYVKNGANIGNNKIGPISTEIPNNSPVVINTVFDSGDPSHQEHSNTEHELDNDLSGVDKRFKQHAEGNRDFPRDDKPSRANLQGSPDENFIAAANDPGELEQNPEFVPSSSVPIYVPGEGTKAFDSNSNAQESPGDDYYEQNDQFYIQNNPDHNGEKILFQDERDSGSYDSTHGNPNEYYREIARNNAKVDEDRHVNAHLPKQGNYDVTVVTDEKITKIPRDNEEVNQEQITSTSIGRNNPAVKRVVERTIDSKGEKVVSTEKRLPTDHIGFILTDDIYDDTTTEDDKSTRGDNLNSHSGNPSPNNVNDVDYTNKELLPAISKKFNDNDEVSDFPSPETRLHEISKKDNVGSKTTNSVQDPLTPGIPSDTSFYNTQLSNYNKFDDDNPLTHGDKNERPPPVGSGYPNWPYTRNQDIHSINQDDEKSYATDTQIARDKIDLYNSNTGKGIESGENDQLNPPTNVGVNRSLGDERVEYVDDNLLLSDQGNEVTSNEKYQDESYSSPPASLRNENGETQDNFNPSVNFKNAIESNNESDQPETNWAGKETEANLVKRQGDSILENDSVTSGINNISPLGVPDTDGRNGWDAPNESYVLGNNDEISDDLRLGIMSEADASTHDKEGIDGNRNENSILGNDWKSEKGPTNKKTFSRETDDHEHINLDNLSEYLRETNENDQTYAKSDDVTKNERNDRGQPEKITDGVRNQIDENGIPNFNDYTYESFGKSGLPFLKEDDKRNPNNNDEFSINTDPVSSKFDILNAGEGSVSVRKISNTFDNNEVIKPGSSDDLDNDQTNIEQPRLSHADDGKDLLPHISANADSSQNSSTNVESDDNGGFTVNGLNDNEISNEELPSSLDAEDVDQESRTESNADSDVPGEETSSSKFFKPESSYDKYEFATPSSDGFSAESAFVKSDSPPSNGFSSSFESVFGQTPNQPEAGSGSFRSLFQNINQDYLKSKNPGGTSSLQNRGGSKGISGVFDGRTNLFDRQLGQIVEKRPSLSLFSRRKR